MQALSRKEAKRVTADLKQAAFEMSPMFQRNAIQAFEQKQRFIVSDQDSIPEELRGEVNPNVTIITLGFQAVRLSTSGRPSYSFGFTYETANNIALREIPEDAHFGVLNAYCEQTNECEVFELPGMEMDDATGDLVDDSEAEKTVNHLKSQLEADPSVILHAYKEIKLHVDEEGTIASEYVVGYTVDGSVVHANSTTDTIFDTYLSRNFMPERELYSEDLLYLDEAAEALEFEDIIRHSGVDDRETLDLESFEDKIRQVRFIMNALKHGDLDPKFWK